MSTKSKKQCKDCGQKKLITEFYTDKARKDGIESHCKACASVRWRKWFKKNEDKARAKWREYYVENKEERKADGRARASTPEGKARQQERDRIRRSNPVVKARNSEAQRAWRLADPERERERWRARCEKMTPEEKASRKQALKKWRRERRKNDGAFRVRETMSRQVAAALKERGKMKLTSTFRLLGYTKADLIRHLKKRFKPGMSLRNHGFGEGKWHVDHVRPLASFHPDDYASIEDMIKVAFALSNLQPLWCPTNQAKSSFWNGRYWRAGISYNRQEEAN